MCHKVRRTLFDEKDYYTIYHNQKLLLFQKDTMGLICVVLLLSVYTGIDDVLLVYENLILSGFVETQD